MTGLKPWEFTVERPEDLGPFADLLADWDHPGEAVVRYLIRKKRFPRKSKEEAECEWFVCFPSDGGPYSYWKTGIRGAFVLPNKSLVVHGFHYYFTSGEAVWAVINAGQFLPRARKKG